jgi:hypothetical protein
MAGQIKKMIDKIIEARSQGDHFSCVSDKNQVDVEGIDPERYNENSEDYPWVMDDVRRIAKEMGVTCNEERKR